MIDTEALRKKVIDLAIQGKLTEQLSSDGDAESLYIKIQEEKAKLIKAGKIKKEKPHLPISKEEISFEIPKNWKWVRLGDVARVYGGKRIPAGRSLTTEDTGHKYIRVSDMKNGTVITDNLLFVPEDIYPIISRYIINKEDVYITVAGTIGKVGKIPPEIDGVNLTENADRIVFDFMNQDWLLWCLSASMIQKQIEQLTTQVAQPKLAIKRIQEFMLPMPPLAEQARIVEKIEEVLTQIDIIDTLQQQYAADIAVLKGKIIDAGIRGKLTEQLPEDGDAEDLYAQILNQKSQLIKEGKIKKEKPLQDIIADEIPFEIPKNWKWVRINDIGSWAAGATPSRGNKNYYENGTIPWIKTGELNDGYINDAEEYISETALKECSVRLNPVGSVLIAMYGATIGKVGILDIEATTNQACCACIPIIIDNRFLFYFLKSNKKRFLEASHGGAQPNISKEIITKGLMPLPPLSEQKRIVARIDAIMEQLN